MYKLRTRDRKKIGESYNCKGEQRCLEIRTRALGHLFQCAHARRKVGRKEG